jgi:endonuclease/exonuclease/phosphatase (EEP) superfamily protein YafD
LALISPWRRLTTLDLAGLILGSLSLGAILALGGAVSPWLDFLAHLEPFYIPLGVALTVVALAPGERSLPGARAFLLPLGVAAAVSALWMTAPDLIAGWTQAGPVAPSRLTLRVMTQNAWEHNTELGATVDGILKADADVVMLQELDGAMRDLPKRLASAYPYQADCTVQTPWCSLAILSKRPIVHWSHHDPAWRPPDWDRLSMLEATIDGGPGGPIDLYTTHLMHPDGRAASVQQTHQLIRALSDIDTAKSVLGGDFNRPPWSFALHALDAGIPIARRTHGVFSWPNRLPWGEARNRWPAPFLPLDQIYAGRDWRVVRVERAPPTGSDHFGVITTLSLRPATS